MSRSWYQWISSSPGLASEGMDTSPAQRLLGRWCKTLLLTTETLLTPGFSLVNDANRLRARKELQQVLQPWRSVPFHRESWRNYPRLFTWWNIEASWNRYSQMLEILKGTTRIANTYGVLASLRPRGILMNVNRLHSPMLLFRPRWSALRPHPLKLKLKLSPQRCLLLLNRQRHAL